MKDQHIRDLAAQPEGWVVKDRYDSSHLSSPRVASFADIKKGAVVRVTQEHHDNTDPYCLVTTVKVMKVGSVSADRIHAQDDQWATSSARISSATKIEILEKAVDPVDIIDREALRLAGHSYPGRRFGIRVALDYAKAHPEVLQ